MALIPSSYALDGQSHAGAVDYTLFPVAQYTQLVGLDMHVLHLKLQAF